MGIRLGTLLLSIFFLVGFLILSIFHYNHKFNTQYHVRNMFPYELNYNSYFLDNAYGNIVMILMCGALCTFFVTFDLNFTYPFFIPIIVSGCLFTLLIPFLVLTPLTKLRAHIFLIVTELVVAMCVPASIGVAAWQLWQLDGNNIAAIISLVGSIAVAIFVLILAFNPNLSLNIKYETKIKDDGTSVPVRPKFIAIAFTEWMLIFLIFIDAIFVFLLMI